MSLKAQIAQLQQEVAYYNDAASLEGIKDSLKTISGRIDDAARGIESEARKHECLKNIEDVDLFVEGGVDALLQTTENLQAFKSLWLEVEHESVSDEKNTLYSLTEALKQTAKLYSDTHQQVWRDWSEEKISLAQVDEFILEQQKKVHGNAELHDRYVRTKKDFDEQVEVFNFDPVSLLRIQQLAQKCAELKGEMNTEDLPDGVKKLFDELNRIGGVALVSLLTPEVMQWLKDNNKLNSLVIKTR
ncbi:protein DpdI [Shewanella sp. 3_MG-2023]|uniref:protein DpdI n=1 Tax=Shewanella sp. 3_MG-2023 TaxID=3062635 RepID=UPI0026E2DF3C|nr:protein DpdI [Shewanella sp. 3_MG-2023]MDO6777382.1 protein DpdI [Shewanella sp. 3_MG-2023]